MKTDVNYEKFPSTLFKPRDIVVNDRTFKYFLVKFDSLFDLHDYLASKPVINTDVFDITDLTSRSNMSQFNGLSYDAAVEDLIEKEDPKYMDEFLQLIKDITNVNYYEGVTYETVRTLAGGHLNTHLYCVGEPLCYETEEIVHQQKFIKIYSALSYSSDVKEEQLLNRSIILMSIISLLEKQGYNIELCAFEMSYEENEVVNHIVGLKKTGEPVSIQGLFKTSKKEFLRRILFGVLETVSVKGPWYSSYGHTCKESFVRKVLNVGDEDLYFGTAAELGIHGDDIEEDFNSVLKKLHLEDTITFSKSQSDFNKKIKSLKR